MYSGRAFALYVTGPGFDPRHLHSFCILYIRRDYHKSKLQDFGIIVRNQFLDLESKS
jgi:hypothetical protein